MTELSQVQRLFRHMMWADGRTLDALRAAAEPPPRAMELLAHVFGAEHNWLARIAGRVPTAAIWPAPAVEDCAALMRSTHASWGAYLAGLSETELGRSVHYVNSAGAAFDSLVGDILLHVCLHGANHRGQVNALLRAAGAVPNAGDYIAFIRGAPAATRQPG
jgi:uncharacterized damage-inducible protein DinB